jgi:hypothetical protein
MFKFFQSLVQRAIVATQNPQNRWIGLFILSGCLLRLIWAEDMKWKADEIWMYETASGVVAGQIPWPYLIILYPFIHIWIAALLRERSRLLIAICGAQLFLSVVFLVFIHIHGGCVDGNYGVVYRLNL